MEGAGEITAAGLKGRTREFSVRVMRLVDVLPKKVGGRAIAGQLVRCATSVGANYHIACRARSTAEFAAKLGIVLEESDECVCWLQLIIDAELMPAKRIESLLQEANELTAVFTASMKTVQKRRAKEQ